MLLYTPISCLVLRSARVNVMASHLSLVDLMLWFMSDGFVPMRFEVMVYGLNIILFLAICISRMLFVFRECVASVFRYTLRLLCPCQTALSRWILQDSHCACLILHPRDHSRIVPLLVRLILHLTIASMISGVSPIGFSAEALCTSDGFVPKASC